jgi:hypothetical protein
MELFLTALLSGLFAGLVAIATTTAIERLGGALGGVLATTPTTIVAASVGFSSRLSGLDLRAALFSVCPGMLINACFLTVWRMLPPKLPQAWSLHRRLAAMVAASLGVWLTGAVIMVLANRGKEDRNVHNVVAAGWACSAILLVGGLVACYRLPESPKSSKRVPLKTLLLRGLGSCVAVGTAVLVSAVDDVAAGFTSTFPAIFLTTMVGLWLSQGAGMPTAATSPMILGSTAVSFYAIVFALLVTHGTPAEPMGPQPEPGIESDAHAMHPVVAAVVTWLLALVCVSLPVALYLRWRRASSGPPAATLPLPLGQGDVPPKEVDTESRLTGEVVTNSPASNDFNAVTPASFAADPREPVHSPAVGILDRSTSPAREGSRLPASASAVQPNGWQDARVGGWAAAAAWQSAAPSRSPREAGWERTGPQAHDEPHTLAVEAPASGGTSLRQLDSGLEASADPWAVRG